VETLPPTITTSSSSPVDTSSLTETQRQLLPSILNRRRASWAYGSKQEDVASVPAVFTGKKTEPKLTVSELISNFNQSKKLGATTSPSSTISVVGSSLPAAVKKNSASLFQQESQPLSSTKSNSSSKILADREKAVFKPLASSIQALQNKAPIANASLSATSLTGAHSGAQQRNPDLPTRARPHHFAWDVRALPRLPEDTVSSPRQEEATEFSAMKVQQQSGEKSVKTKEEPKEKTVSPEVAAGFGLRSGSVSSDTGCSSSSDLSDRSSDECPDKDAQRGRSEQNQETNAVEETGPSASWQGRPRSFSVQSDISFLAQPWNRVCTGSVARAFEKFGTKVDGDVTVASTTAPTSSMPHRSRRQSTPGPLK
jgi:hypothetical protein